MSTVDSDPTVSCNRLIAWTLSYSGGRSVTMLVSILSDDACHAPSAESTSPSATTA